MVQVINVVKVVRVVRVVFQDVCRMVCMGLCGFWFVFMVFHDFWLALHCFRALFSCPGQLNR